MPLFGNKPEVSVSVDPREVVAGESVRVRAEVGEPDRKTQGARVELLYRNTYREDDVDSDGDRTTRTRTTDVLVATEHLDLADAPLGGADVELAVPADAPGTAYESVAWVVRAVVDRKRARDARAEQDLIVRVPADQLAPWASGAPNQTAAPKCLLTIEPSTRVVRPGESITGTLTVAPRERISARAIRVQLRRLRLDPDRNTSQDDGVRVELCGAVDLAPGEERSFPFAIDVPSAVPPSFRARYNEQHWYLDGVVDVKRSSDPAVQLEILVHTA
jgi:sporulation-control protein spo0M